MENRGKHVKDMEDSLKKNLTCITGEPRRQEERELRRMNRKDRSQITATWNSPRRENIFQKLRRNKMIFR